MVFRQAVDGCEIFVLGASIIMVEPIVVRIPDEKKFGGLWQESYCFPSIAEGSLYYSKRSRLVIENLVANEGRNWRLIYANLGATKESSSLPAAFEMEIVGTTISFTGIKNQNRHFLMIQIDMADPRAELHRQIAEMLAEGTAALWELAVSMPGTPVAGIAIFEALYIESQLARAEEAGTSFDMYIFKWSPGNGDYSLWSVPIYRI